MAIVVYGECENCHAEVEFTNGDHPSQHMHVFCSGSCEDDFFSEPDIDDSVKACPECDTPNQFGEMCGPCEADEQIRILEATGEI